MTQRQNGQNLRERLSKLVAQSELFEQHLRDEQEALRTDDWQRLVKATQGKQNVIERLSRIDAEVRQLANLASHSNNDSVYSILRARSDQDPELSAQVDRLLSTTLSCRELNQQNRKLVSVGLKQTSRMLNFLRGISNDDASELYGPAGYTHTSVGSNEIAQA